MKKYLVFFILLPMLVWAQTDQSTLYEVVNISVIPGHEADFEAAVKAHNAAFHANGAHTASVYSNINGPWGGTYSWIMGPMKWADQENRPSGDAHDADWAKVMSHIGNISNPDYWNGSVSLSHIASAETGDMQVGWIFDLKTGKEAQWAELVGKVKKVYAEKRPTESFMVGWNAFANKEGHDAIMIWPFKSWADMDDQRDFGKEFDEVHGSGSWHNFLNQIDECVKSRVDALRVAVN